MRHCRAAWSTAASAGFSPAAADRGHHPVGGRAAASMMALSPAPHSVRSGQGFLQLERRAIGYSRKPRVEFFGQFRKRSHIAIGSQRFDPAVARAAQQVHGAVTDRAGRTKHGYGGADGGCRGRIITQGLRSSRHQTIRPRPTPMAPPRRRPKIAATTTAATNLSRRIHQPAMAGDDVTGTSRQTAVSHCGLEETAALRNHRQRCTEQQQRTGFAQDRAPQTCTPRRGSATQTADRAGPLSLGAGPAAKL